MENHEFEFGQNNKGCFAGGGGGQQNLSCHCKGDVGLQVAMIFLSVYCSKNDLYLYSSELIFSPVQNNFCF